MWISLSGPPSCGGIFDYDQKFDQLSAVSRELEDPAVWNNAERAQELSKEKKALEGVVVTLDRVGDSLKDADELFAMAREENDDDTLLAVGADLAGIEKDIGSLEFRRMFNNPADPLNCFVDIQAGAGGTEAQDWASMLLRMYVKYGERKGYTVDVLEESEGDVAGIKTATIKLSGEYCFGMLRSETGIHRLVRKSPFDSNARRHTSFASVFVYPRSTTRSRSRLTRPTCASTPTAPRARAVSTSIKPIRRYASPTFRRASSCNARTTARSTATGPRRWPC